MDRKLVNSSENSHVVRAGGRRFALLMAAVIVMVAFTLAVSGCVRPNVTTSESVDDQSSHGNVVAIPPSPEAALAQSETTSDQTAQNQAAPPEPDAPAPVEPPSPSVAYDAAMAPPEPMADQYDAAMAPPAAISGQYDAAKKYEAAPASPSASPMAVYGGMASPKAMHAVKAYRGGSAGAALGFTSARAPEFNTEVYDRIEEGGVKETLKHPLSTFSIDVDTAAYSNVRRFLNGGTLPPPDAVRVEELINYFSYQYPQPAGDKPFSLSSELTEAPWKPGHKLLRIGLQGRNVAIANVPPANLVFLLDVSGSMADDNKLPLLVKAFKMLVKQLRPQDHVAIVTYAGQAGLALPSTSGADQGKINAVLDSLVAEGSTNGGEGIQLAYRIARENFVKKGNNRIILATDGDFNVGMSSDGDLERMIEERRKDGIFLSVLGVGMGNYKDSRMEKLADKGNGNYAYLDNLLEAKKVLVRQFGGTMLTIAKDVKLQVEFNPAKVKSYRLIGYEKRALQAEDFANDKKDAGELGSGHTVTALYEIELADPATASKEELVYQTTQVKPEAYKRKELATVRLRYKQPDGDTSSELVDRIGSTATPIGKASESTRFAAAVAEWGMLLRGSEYAGGGSYQQVLDLARSSRGTDDHGDRTEFVRLVETAELVGARQVESQR